MLNFYFQSPPFLRQHLHVQESTYKDVSLLNVYVYFFLSLLKCEQSFRDQNLDDALWTIVDYILCIVDILWTIFALPQM